MYQQPPSDPGGQLFQTAKQAVYETAPSGVLYAAVMAAGVTFEMYNAIVDQLVREQRIVQRYHVLYPAPILLDEPNPVLRMAHRFAAERGKSPRTIEPTTNTGNDFSPPQELEIILASGKPFTVRKLTIEELAQVFDIPLDTLRAMSNPYLPFAAWPEDWLRRASEACGTGITCLGGVLYCEKE
jgi:hypothetical protein